MSINNDYELIYLVQSEYDQQAFLRLVQKYERMMYKMIHNLNINYNDFDDFYQEALMVLYKAIQTFDERFDKTFTRYYELLLKRHLLRFKINNPVMLFLEDVNTITDYKHHYRMEDVLNQIEFTHPIEQIIHQQYFIEKQTQASICEKNGLTKKQVYNAVHRVKAKYKDVL